MRAQGAMYKAVVQSVILYISNIWVVTGVMLKVLEGFHHQVEQGITEMTEERGEGGEWYFPLVVETMETAGIHPIGVYIRRRQENISKRVVCRPI